MNRFLQVFNLLGTLVLSILLVIQWRVNSAVNRQAISLESVRHEQQIRLEEDACLQKNEAADLNDFRGRLVLAESQLKEMESKLELTTTDRNQLAKHCEQLKSTLFKWMAAVTDRDAAIKQAGDKITKVAAERDDLTLRYNKLVRDWNVLQSK